MKKNFDFQRLFLKSLDDEAKVFWTSEVEILVWARFPVSYLLAQQLDEPAEVDPRPVDCHSIETHTRSLKKIFIA